MSLSEERIRSLEYDVVRAKTIIKVLTVLGIGLGAAFAYSWASVRSLNEQVVSTSGDATALETRLSNLKELLDEGVKQSVNDDALRVAHTNQSTTAQIQAQAICTAVAPKGTTVMAVFRRPTGTDSQGRAVSETCPSICPRLTMVGTSRQASSIGAVHVYNGSFPFSSETSDITSAGLATHIYSPNDANEGFGPNYCCCAG